MLKTEPISGPTAATLDLKGLADGVAADEVRRHGFAGHGQERLAETPPIYWIASISPGRQVLSNHGSSGLYSLSMVNQPLPGTV